MKWTPSKLVGQACLRERAKVNTKPVQSRYLLGSNTMHGRLEAELGRFWSRAIACKGPHLTEMIYKCLRTAFIHIWIGRNTFMMDSWAMHSKLMVAVKGA